MRIGQNEDFMAQRENFVDLVPSMNLVYVIPTLKESLHKNEIHTLYYLSVTRYSRTTRGGLARLLPYHVLFQVNNWHRE